MYVRYVRGFARSNKAFWGAAAAIALLSACDRHPAPSGLTEWTSADHDGEKAAAPNGKQGARAQGDGGGTPALVEITWRNQCAACHGASGKADGPQSAMFKPPDRSQSK